MYTPSGPEPAARATPERDSQHRREGASFALAGTPVQMLLMLQRTAGNQAVNQLLRAYKSSRQGSPVGFRPAVQRCGGKPCHCSPQEKAAHNPVQPIEDTQDLTGSGITQSSVQRDADPEEDDGASEGGTAPTEQAAGAVGGGGGSSEGAAPADDPADGNAEQPTQGSNEGAPATDGTDEPGDGDQNPADTAQAEGGQTADPANPDDSAADAVEPVPPVEGEGESHDEVVFGGDSLQLQGRTNAAFRNSFATQHMTTTAGDGCGCAAADCVHVTGTLVSTFTMTTNVSLPSVPSGLTNCQQRTVRVAITNCLSPHEQRHVAAFNAYRGTVSTPFDINCCRADVHSSLQAIHEGVEGPRHDQVQQTSDALDPFQVDIDLDCQPGADPNAGVHCPPPP